MDKKIGLQTPLVENIRRFRKQAGLTQVEVASRVGIKQATYSAMERGRQKIFADYLPKIAAVLNVRMSDLFGEPAQSTGTIDEWSREFLRATSKFNPEEKAVLMNMAHLISKKHCPGDEEEESDGGNKTILKNQPPKKARPRHRATA